MTNAITLTKLRLIEGVWHGIITSEDANGWEPKIEVTHLGERIDGSEVVPAGENTWNVSVPVPADKISDGVQTFIIRDTSLDEVLGSFAIVAGDALAEDIRAELTLLREELDMLKKAFRRHCAETM